MKVKLRIWVMGRLFKGLTQSPGFKSTQGGFLYLPVKMTCGVSHSGKLQLEFSLSTDTVSTSFITCFAF